MRWIFFLDPGSFSSLHSQKCETEHSALWYSSQKLPFILVILHTHKSASQTTNGKVFGTGQLWSSINHLCSILSCQGKRTRSRRETGGGVVKEEELKYGLTRSTREKETVLVEHHGQLRQSNQETYLRIGLFILFMYCSCSLSMHFTFSEKKMCFLICFPNMPDIWQPVFRLTCN